MSQGPNRREMLVGAGAAVSALAWTPGARAQAARRAPFTIVINNSPWFDGFRGAVEAYEKESGNKVNLDVNPFGGSLEKQRASVRARDGQFDLLIMNGLYYQEMYHGGFLTPINDIDPAFRLDPQMIRYDNTVYWNAAAKSHDPSGKLMSVPVNGNIPLLLYRADLYEEHKLKVPETWDQLLENANKLHNPPRIYGIVQRGARGAPAPAKQASVHRAGRAGCPVRCGFRRASGSRCRARPAGRTRVPCRHSALVLRCCGCRSSPRRRGRRGR